MHNFKSIFTPQTDAEYVQLLLWTKAEIDALYLRALRGDRSPRVTRALWSLRDFAWETGDNGRAFHSKTLSMRRCADYALDTISAIHAGII